VKASCVRAALRSRRWASPAGLANRRKCRGTSCRAPVSRRVWASRHRGSTKGCLRKRRAACHGKRREPNRCASSRGQRHAPNRRRRRNVWRSRPGLRSAGLCRRLLRL
jgi:hypothetical protein